VLNSPFIAKRSDGAVGGRSPSLHIHAAASADPGGNANMMSNLNLHRRQFLHLVAGAAALPVRPGIASAQAYPTRPVRIVVGFPPGGVGDILARLIGQSLSERLGQPVIIENRPGAGSNIAAEMVVKAPPDGYTLYWSSSANATSGALNENLSFNFMRDLAPIASISSNAMVMEVNPSVPPKTVSEFVAYAKANPGKLNMASNGNASTSHLAGELFKMMTGTTMIHVPYRGAGPALTDLIAGQVQIMFVDVTSSIEHIRAGKVRALAVTTIARSEMLPDVPTIAEFVPGSKQPCGPALAHPRTHLPKSSANLTPKSSRPSPIRR
jgi:tripartite-type tricarboxylate transporter receptor subunit TctC